MEAVVVVIRPKHHATVSQDFRAKAYDVLLTEFQPPNSDNSIKQIPKTTISFEEEPPDALCSFLYNLTGAEFGGIKGKRAVFIAPSRTEPMGDHDSLIKGTLYCVPVDSKDKLNAKFVDNLPSSPGFYSLDLVLETLNNNAVTFSKQTRYMLNRLESWLKEKHKVPGALDLLFSVCTEDRLKRSITNPAYFTDSQTHSALGTIQVEEEFSRSIANEALAKMLAIEKCDITIINPLFGSDLIYKTKVDALAVNKFWGVGRPDYTRVIPPHAGSHRISTMALGSESWVEEFPMHRSAYEGDSDGVRELLKEYSVTQKDRDSWAPIHYAAWFGHLKTISVLLNQGECSPNITNENGAAALHLAASRGRVYVVELLLNHPEIDVTAVDKYGKTALNLCENIEKADWQSAAVLLRGHLSRPTPTIQVCLMDGTFRMLNLVSGANTTVQQLHTQMMRELEIPDSCGHLFTIWICSRNLQLQLKPDHKPIQHLNDWKRLIVGMLTDQEPSREDPQLIWRRDAIISIAEEKQVRNTAAISLLFHEAYHNYIKSMYPCSEQDAIIIGGILMQLNQADYDPQKTKRYFNNERSLNTLVPMTLLRHRKTDWGSKISAQYRYYSSTLVNRDRSPQVLQQHFLQICWNLTVYGSAFFTGYVQVKTTRSPTTVLIGVNDIGVHIINAQSKTMLQSFGYKDIEWQHQDGQPVLELKLKGSSRGGMFVMTKQAGLVQYFMTKLSTKTSPSRDSTTRTKDILH